LRALQVIKRDFSHNARKKGEAYYRDGAVEITKAEPNHIRARVEGTNIYQVSVDWNGTEYNYSCSCPVYDEYGDMCKHLWATVLAADERRLLTVVDAPGDGNGDDIDEDDDDPEFEPEVQTMTIGNRRLELIKYRERPQTDQPRRHAVWRRRLDEIRNDFHWHPVSEPAPWPAEREIVYVINEVDANGSQELAIELCTRSKDKPLALRSLRMQHNQVNILPDPVDRQLLGMLVGIAAVDDDDGYEDSSVPGQVWLRNPGDAPLVMRMICQTGRCIFHSETETGDDLFQPLVWDEGTPWEFHLAVVTDEKAKAYRLQGLMRRGEEQMEITRPHIFLPGGLVIMGNKVAEFKDHGANRFIHLLRAEPNLQIPFEQGDQFLGELFLFPRIPPLQLPPQMDLQQVRLDPKPRLTITPPPKSSGGNGRLSCMLAFSYGDLTVLYGQNHEAVFDNARRQVIYRDLAAERNAGAHLRELGFRPADQWNGMHHFQLIPRKLPAAVRDLTARQWQVEVNGKSYRQPGKINMQVSSGIDWFELDGKADFEGVSVRLPALLQAISKGDSTVVLDDGTVGILPEEWLKRYGLLAAVANVKDDAIQFAKSQVGLLDALLAEIPAENVDEPFAKAREELRRFEAIAPVDPPQTFIGLLRPYQREGLGWLDFLRTFGMNGCLADDMGLGKTVQVLALLEERRLLRQSARAGGQTVPGPSLVVVPRSLVFNWQQEAIKFAPRLRVLDHATGDRLKTTDHFEDFDLILTTYGTLRNDVAHWRDVRFDYVILDEAQAIKNASSESAKAARLLGADHRLALSGTPVQNHLGELWSLLEFLNPGMLGASRAFAAMTEKADRAASADARKFLAGALRPFILRRTKSQVAADLPEKFEQTIFCELDKPQRALYDELKEHYRQSLLGKIERDGLGKSKLQVLEALLRLRQAACHPGLVNKSRVGDPSAKLDMLLPRLAELAEEGHKTIVFSQFTSFLAIARKKLDEQNAVYEYLDGKTRDRQQRVDRFQTDENCKLFLISLKAGGLGLNLTAAQYVFLLDPWWNPAIEAQAIDRAHRIGQTRQVFAYRLIARDTVEEKVLTLQQSKRELADAIINADNALISKLGREDLEMLLS